MILVLGGTSDSLLVCEALNKAGEVYQISVTTEYGKTLARQYTPHVIMGTLDLEAMTELILKEAISSIIDATHPYATEVSKTAMKAAKSLGKHYVRYERASLLEETDYDKLHIVSDTEEACTLANQMGKNIFLSTGSKNLAIFWNLLKDKRLVARVLPTSKVIEACEEIGFSADTIIAMKGPFSTEMNEELYKAYNCDLVITKESGNEGGFLEKIEACKLLDIPAIVIKRATIEYPLVVHEIAGLLKNIN